MIEIFVLFRTDYREMKLIILIHACVYNIINNKFKQ